METEPAPTASSASPWRAGSIVFAARTLAGSKAVLWLVPRFDPLDTGTDSAPKVRFAPCDEQPAAVDLQAVWWLFDPSCADCGCTHSCACGEVTLADLMSLLGPECADAALAAHAELLEVVVERCSALRANGLDSHHAVELTTVIGELAGQLARAAAVARTAAVHAELPMQLR